MFLASNSCWVSSGTVKARYCWEPRLVRGGKAGNEKVQTGEGHHVDGKLAQVRVELTREAKAGGHSAHDGRHKVVEVTIGGGGQLEGTEADVVQGLVVNAVGLIGVLNELVDGQGGVVGLNDSVRHLG